MYIVFSYDGEAKGIRSYKAKICEDDKHCEDYPLMIVEFTDDEVIELTGGRFCVAMKKDIHADRDELEWIALLVYNQLAIDSKPTAIKIEYNLEGRY